MRKTRNIRVADVEYNDDDNYDRHVLMQIHDTDTEDDVIDYLAECGEIGIYVNEIRTKRVPLDYKDNFYSVIDVYK